MEVFCVQFSLFNVITRLHIIKNIKHCQAYILPQFFSFLCRISKLYSFSSLSLFTASWCAFLNEKPSTFPPFLYYFSLVNFSANYIKSACPLSYLILNLFLFLIALYILPGLFSVFSYQSHIFSTTVLLFALSLFNSSLNAGFSMIYPLSLCYFLLIVSFQKLKLYLNHYALLSS